MKLSTNPFSLYDFLGYFLTGFLCVYLLNFGVLSGVIKSDLLLNLIDKFSKQNNKEFDDIFIIIFCYVTGHTISFISSITIEQYNIFVYKYPSKYLLNKVGSKAGWKDYFTKGQKTKNFHRFVLLLILAPLVIIDLIFGHFLKFKKFFTRSINNSLIPIVDKKLSKIYSERMLDINDHKGESYIIDEYFLPIYHYVIEKSDKHNLKSQNYVALYGFLRNMTLLSMITSWSLILFFNSSEIILSCYLLVGNLLLTYIFFLGYLKFFRLFSREVIFGALACE